MHYALLYVATILLLNLGFSYVPMIETPIGLLSPMAIIAGAVFVLRDFAQREVGHHVLWFTALGAFLSFVLADPFVAVASVLAFTSSELVDWLLYTVTKKPFHKRVWISSLLSTPIDTAVFLFWIEQASVGTFVLMVLSKLIAAGVIWYIGNRNPYLFERSFRF